MTYDLAPDPLAQAIAATAAPPKPPPPDEPPGQLPPVHEQPAGSPWREWLWDIAETDGKLGAFAHDLHDAWYEPRDPDDLGRIFRELTSHGHDEDDVRSLLRRWEQVRSTLQAAPGATASTWRPVDLDAALAGEDVDPPTMLERTDGLRLLYPGRVHWLAGESESAKSWLAQYAAAVELAAGRDVLYVDFEDDDRSVVARLRALGVDPDAIRNHLTYLRPDEALADRYGNPTAAAADLEAVLAARSYVLAIVDGVTEAMTTENLELLDNADIARWIRTLPKRLAATGAAVAVIDHVTKNGDGSSRYALGGQHKLAGIDGAAYKLAVRRQLARATGDEPVYGEVAITLSKDRPGYVRGRTTDGQVGTANLTAYPDGGVAVRLDPPGRGGPDHRVVTAILEYLQAYDGSSKNAVEQGVDAKAERTRESLRWMVEEGWLRVEHKGASHLHWLTDAGREQLQ